MWLVVEFQLNSPSSPAQLLLGKPCIIKAIFTPFQSNHATWRVCLPLTTTINSCLRSLVLLFTFNSHIFPLILLSHSKYSRRQFTPSGDPSAFLQPPTKGMFLELRLSFSFHSSIFVAKCLYDPCLFVSFSLDCSPRYACTHSHSPFLMLLCLIKLLICSACQYS